MHKELFEKSSTTFNFSSDTGTYIHQQRAQKAWRDTTPSYVYYTKTQLTFLFNFTQPGNDTQDLVNEVKFSHKTIESGLQ